LLANHFVQKYTEEHKKAISHISPEALDILTQYSWPGNVRELENTIERAVILTVHPIILPRICLRNYWTLFPVRDWEI